MMTQVDQDQEMTRWVLHQVASTWVTDRAPSEDGDASRPGMGNAADAQACLENFIEFHTHYGDSETAEFLTRAGEQIVLVATAAAGNDEFMQHGLPYAIYKTIDGEKDEVTRDSDTDLYKLHAYLAFLTEILNLLEAKKGRRGQPGVQRKELEACRTEVYRMISA